MLRKGILKSVLAGGVCAMAIATAAAAQTREFDVPAGDLQAALDAYAKQSEIQLLYRVDLVKGVSTRGAQGALPPDEALSRLLAGTGLAIKRHESGAVAIVQAGEGGSVPQAGSAVEALIVTAQKKEEQIQDVPIAISAFSQQDLDAQKLEGGFDLLKAIPNVTFSKNNFTSYNFSIRGIGTKAISATTDPGVAVSFNNTTLIVNRLFEQEYFDVERVEVLRGPQGTLYGRNATSGVINVISAKPRMGDFEAEIKAETGNYNAQRLRGMVNIPVGETFAVRLAGAATKRDGYGYNEFDGSDVDDRNLWSARLTLGWEPNETFRANLLWEHFNEDDERVRTSKQLCKRDPGLETVDGFVVSNHANPLARYGSETSQGCLPTSLYSDEAFGTPNGASLPPILGSYFATFFTSYPGGYGYRPDAVLSNPGLAECPLILDPEVGSNAGYILNICQFDPYGGKTQSRDLRSIASRIRPAYRAEADVFDLSWDWEFMDGLTLTSQTVYNKDDIYSTQDFNRFHTLPVFTDTSTLCGNNPINGGPCNPGTYSGGQYADYAPGGVYTDPQLGPSDTIMGQDISQGGSTQFTQEFRLASAWDGPLNFSLGANYTDFDVDIDYYVFFNILSYLAQNTALFNGPGGPFAITGAPCANYGLRCVYVDPNPLESIDGQGHNYFRSRNPYELQSTGLFGEVYWQATDTLKVTAGLRYSWDEKVFTPYPTQLLLYDYRELVRTNSSTLHLPPGSPPEACLERPNIDYTYLCPAAGDAPGGKGFVAGPKIIQNWEEPTGRLVVDWKPDVPLTDETMIYGSYSHGYKGGGANPPSIAAPAGLYIAAAAGAVARPTFDPEYVDAFELGAKNTLLGGALVFNATAFKYFYESYQISKIVDRTAANENFDAEVWGIELEGLFAPTRNLRFNFALGYLDTEIGEGERSIDLMDRTQGGSHTSYLDLNGVEHALGYDEWVVLKPWINGTSNCVVPAELVRRVYQSGNPVFGGLCLGGGFNGTNYANGNIPGAGAAHFDPATEAPNAGAGFFAELAGNELPNAPHWTASLGAQYSFGLPGGWDATLRGDFYWQSQSFARVYNTQYDKLRPWSNTNISLWFERVDWGLTAEVYVKNVFDEEPITDAFLNGDDAALTTNVFTLDPRLVGVSVRKAF